jgi:ParB-like chromosome segregation protein Spo0J
MKTVEKVEIAHLGLRYEHTRIRQLSSVIKMSASLERFGQLMPVLAVDSGDGAPTLIDGYLRVKALKHMGRDLVVARMWEQSEPDALVYMMAGMQGRVWDVYEQAAIINELRLTHGISCGQIAALLGKDKSWVTRRLLLFETLDEKMIALIRRGKISSWSAQRILVPLARANPDHAELLIKALQKENISTRRLSLLFEHYKKSNRNIRQNIVSEPHLFLKAMESELAHKNAETIRQGPEGKWLKDIRVVRHILMRLVKATPEVFYPGQSRLDQRRLLSALRDAAIVMETLKQRIDDDQKRNPPNDFIAAPDRLHDPAHQSHSQGVAQHGSQCH